MTEKGQILAGMTQRQKVTAVVFVIVIIFLLWQIIGLFRGNSSSTSAITPINNTKVLSANGNVGQSPVEQMRPQPAQMKTEAPLSEREVALIKLQQETQQKYLAALNELQMLKISKQIAEVNKDIAAAKLATVSAEKNTLSLLTGPTVAAGDYAKGLENSGRVALGSEQKAGASLPAQVSYNVISVSQLQKKWSAVLGYQGNLYHVSEGDVLPADGSVVISIDRNSVVLEKEGARKKLPLVSLI